MAQAQDYLAHSRDSWLNDAEEFCQASHYRYEHEVVVVLTVTDCETDELVHFEYLVEGI